MRSLPFHPALEGLRGLAVLLVLLFHGGVWGFGGGFLGVSTFFTLSGFLITGLLVAEREREGTIRLGAFWGRRFRRIMPPALVALALTAVLGASFADPVQLERLRIDGLASLFYFANWWLITSGAAYADLMGSPSWLQHFWSLAIEEQYYAVFPLVAALLLRRSGRVSLALLLAAGTLTSWLWMTHLALGLEPTERLYYGTDTRVGELLCGGLLALAISGRTLGPRLARLAPSIGVLGLLASAVYWFTASVSSAWLYEGGLPLYALATVATLLGCVAPRGPVRAWLSGSAIRWLGRVSYGAYVYHWPVFLVLNAERTGLAAVPLFGLRVVVTLGAAALSYYALERPIRSGRWPRSRSRWLAAPLAAAGVIALYQPLDSSTPDPVGEGVPLQRNAPRVVVIGDSLAKSVVLGLKDWSRSTGRVEFRNMARPGCGLTRGGWLDDADRDRAVCDAWVQKLPEMLARMRPGLVVALTSGWDMGPRQLPQWSAPRSIGDPLFDDWLVSQYVAIAEDIASHAIPVLWLTTPCGRDPLGRTELDAGLRARTARMNDAILPGVVDRTPAVIATIDLFSAVCPKGAFVDEMEGIAPFRPDGIHFSERGRRWVADWLAPEMLRVWSSHIVRRELRGTRAGTDARERES